MLSVTFRCPRCEETATTALAANMGELSCPRCGATTEVPEGAIVEAAGQEAVENDPKWGPSHGPSLTGRGVGVRRCLVCPSRDLFVRKDFPQRLGVAIVVVGFAGFLIANYYYMKYWAFGFLFATALIDVLLYFFMGEALVCYRCGAHYRGVEDLGDHTGFELETHERHRQMAARMAEAERERGRPRSSVGDPQD